MMVLIIPFIFIVAVLALIITNICIVPQASAWIIERLGKYQCTWDAGLHIKIPFIDRVIKKISLKEQVADFEPQPVITKDNVTMMVDSVVFFNIFDPKSFAYGVERPIAAIENLSARCLKKRVLTSAQSSWPATRTKLPACLQPEIGI